MIDTPQIVQTERRPTAVIRVTVPRADIQKVMGPAITEVMQTVAAQGIAPAGAIFSHHFRMSPDVFDFEVGVPVARPIAGAGRVLASELPAATVAQTVYHGPYEGLGAAWGEFDRWISSNGHSAAPNLWECYVTDPAAGSDPSTWRTELNRPLVR